MAATVVALAVTAFLAIIATSLFTNIKIPLVDYTIANMVAKHQIKKKRKKNNFCYGEWKLVSFDMETQDFKWEHREDKELVAKLRIKYNISKGIFVAFHNRWAAKDVLEETTVEGDPKYLLKLFGIPRRIYTVIDATKDKRYRKIVGYGMKYAITMNTALKSK